MMSAVRGDCWSVRAGGRVRRARTIVSISLAPAALEVGQVELEQVCDRLHLHLKVPNDHCQQSSAGKQRQHTSTPPPLPTRQHAPAPKAAAAAPLPKRQQVVVVVLAAAELALPLVQRHGMVVVLRNIRQTRCASRLQQGEHLKCCIGVIPWGTATRT